MSKKAGFSIALVFCAALLCGYFADGSAEGPSVIGVQKCKGCHKPAKIGNQFGLWSERRHAKAFETLGSDAAKAMAAEKGLGDPQTVAECLACHTTQGHLGAEVVYDATYSIEEGVGCEACHGPGSAYKPKKIMEDHAAAVAAGLVEITEAVCTGCHNEKSPSFKGFKFEEAVAAIAHPVPEPE